MPTTIRPTSAERLLERLEREPARMAKADLKTLEHVGRAQIGRVVVRCFLLAGVSQKEAAALLDRDQGQVARWCSGAERPAFDVIFAVPTLRRPLVIAWAEIAGEGVHVDTVITVKGAA